MVQTTELSSGWEFAQLEWLGEPPFGYTRLPGWLPARVPGHVHLDLVDNGIIRHPFEGMAELGCQWVDECDWSYRKRFAWHAGDPPKRVLKFEGLDTICTIFLNGEEIGRHDNMFLPLEIDVSDRLVEGENELRIDFQSASRVGRERRQAYFQRHGISADVLNFDERAFVRKAQYMFGWDWGPRLGSCGIWKPVKLIEYDARIRGVSLRSAVQPDGSATIHVETDFDGAGVVPRHILGDQQFLDGTNHLFCFSQDNPEDAHLRAGIFRWEVTGREWWPAQIDEDGRALNSMITVLADTTDPQLVRLLEGQEPGWPDPANPEKYKDDHWLSIGLAAVELRREPDAFGESFEFFVNGKPVWARGANWIPINSFPSFNLAPPPLNDDDEENGPSRETGRSLRELLESCASMNFNMLRVWGGGLYESDEFYELCDELGILVWQDFPFACSYYPDDEEFVEKIREEATYHVKRLRHHPCLALWCGNNENLTMWEGKWGGADRQPDRFHGERIWNEVLRKVVAEHDPGRTYIPTSPIGSPPGVQDCNAGGYGDSHYWDVWHGRGDWVHYSDSTARFSSEFGFPSSCSRKAWAEVTSSPPQLISPSSPDIRWHDKTGRPFEYLRDLITRHYPEPKTLDEWIYYSQLNQRDAMRHAIEHYRRSEFCKGTLIWQLNDCWPVQSWSLIDSAGQWKAAAHELQRLYADLLVSYERIDDTVKLWVINDSQEAYETGIGDAVGVHDSITGESVVMVNIEPGLTCPPGGRSVVVELNIADLDPTRSIVWTNLFLTDPCRLICEPKELQLRNPTIRARIERPGSLEVTPDAPVIDLFLWDDTGGAEFHIHPHHHPSGNFRTFETESPWTYGYRGEIGQLRARSLAGEHEVELSS